jgi:hypothetical protein
MGIDAVALLKGKDFVAPERLRVQRLDDAVLVHTDVAFGGDIEMLAYGVRTALGDALDAHDDQRGIFVLPDVAKPRGKTYDAVIEEIGEAGEWVRKIGAGEIPEGLLGAPDGSFAAAIGEAMQAIGTDNLAEIQRALASGDFSAIEKLQAQMAAALGGEDQLNALAARVLNAANAEGALPEDLSELQGQIDPAQLAELEKMIKK